LIITRTNCTKFSIAKIDKIIYNMNMSVRKIKKSYLSCTGYFASYKNKNQVAFESVLERDLFMILEFDTNVVKYEEQPMQVFYPFNDKTRKYTPDVLVTYQDATQKLIEVKYSSELVKKPELINKFNILQEYFSIEHNLSFELFTDKQINTLYLDNLKFLYNFAFIPIHTEYTNRIKELLRHHDVITIKDILSILATNRNRQLQYIPYIWNFIFKNIHQVEINLYKKLTMATYITLKNKHE